MNFCQVCNEPFKVPRNSLGKYCSNSCQQLERQIQIVQTWLNDQTPETFYHAGNQPRPAVRRYLIEKFDFKCSACGWDKKRSDADLPSLEIEHIDGNWLNCLESNLTIYCPNCHSLTDTYKGRNKGNGRAYRRLQ